MIMTPAQASGDDDLRLAPVLTVLWAGGDGADAAAIGEAAKLAQAAARAAAERWPDIYRGPGRARLICRDDEPPSAGRDRGGQARRRRDRRAWRRGVGVRRGAVGRPRLRQDSRFAAGAGGGIGRGAAAGDRFRRRAGAGRRASSARRRGDEPRGDRRGAAVAAAPPGRPAGPRRVSARRREQPPASLRIRVAAAADRRAVGDRFGASTIPGRARRRPIPRRASIAAKRSIACAASTSAATRWRSPTAGAGAARWRRARSCSSPSTSPPVLSARCFRSLRP